MSDFVFRHVFFLQPERDIFRHGKRIEQSALLKHEADVPPEIQQVPLVHFVQIVPHHPDAPFVGTQQPGRHLHDQRLARTAFAKKHFGFAGPHLEGYVLQNVTLIETDAHVLESNERFARNGLGLSLCRRRAREVGHTKDYRGIRRGFREGSIISPHYKTCAASGMRDALRVLEAITKPFRKQKEESSP